MICKSCGTEIADKALVCYRCGQATFESRVKPGGPTARRGRVRLLVWLIVAAWLVGAAVVWDVVFEARNTRGAIAYVAAQKAFAEGRGPRADMDQMMDAARSEGLRAASGWAAVELAPGAALGLLFWLRTRRGRGGRPLSSR
jgi:hypothetical protein